MGNTVNKRVIIAGIGLGVLGIILFVIAGLHYGFNWEPKSTGELACGCVSGLTAGIGFSMAIREWMKGDKKEK
jgi:hypothetical protein